MNYFSSNLFKFLEIRKRHFFLNCKLPYTIVGNNLEICYPTKVTKVNPTLVNTTKYWLLENRIHIFVYSYKIEGFLKKKSFSLNSLDKTWCIKSDIRHYGISKSNNVYNNGFKTVLHTFLRVHRCSVKSTQK